jgi:hypothetical protein
MNTAITWLSPWYPVDDASVCQGLEYQLRVEICDRHVLAGHAARLIARRADTDDALFSLAGERVAEVHLTWKNGTEEDPRWPATALFPSLEDWMRDSMMPLHEELSRLGQ